MAKPSNVRSRPEADIHYRRIRSKKASIPLIVASHFIHSGDMNKRKIGVALVETTKPNPPKGGHGKPRVLAKHLAGDPSPEGSSK
jgi:hypothetical protein